MIRVLMDDGWDLEPCSVGQKWWFIFPEVWTVKPYPPAGTGTAPGTEPTGRSHWKEAATQVHELRLNVSVAVANHRKGAPSDAQPAGPEGKAPRKGTLLLFLVAPKSVLILLVGSK